MDLQTIFIISNALIAVAYLGNGLYWAPRLRLGSGTTQTAIRVSAGGFFVLCAATHIELALHARDLITGGADSVHWIAIHALQGPFGIAFLAIARNFTGAQILDTGTAPRAMPTMIDWQARWKFVRDVILFFSGLGGVGYFTITGQSEAVMLMVFVSMMGLPILLRADEKKTPSV